jgi:hypothetical protein
MVGTAATLKKVMKDNRIELQELKILKHKECQKLRHQFQRKIVAAATHYSCRCTQELSTKLL